MTLSNHCKAGNFTVGKKFSRLTVVENPKRNASGKLEVLCRCDCGKEKIVATTLLRSGITKSCGCLKIDNGRSKRIHGMRRHPAYIIWAKIIQRCTNPSVERYPQYGGRGITVCDEWEDFSVFRDWANKNGYIEGKLDLDRIDNNSGYRPDNCRFISHRENLCNTRRRIVTEIEGKEETLSEIAIRVGIPYNVVWGRYKRGERGDRLERKRDKTFKKSR